MWREFFSWMHHQWYSWNSRDLRGCFRNKHPVNLIIWYTGNPFVCIFREELKSWKKGFYEFCQLVSELYLSSVLLALDTWYLLFSNIGPIYLKKKTFVMRDSLPIPRPHGPALLNYDQANGTIAHFLFNFLP